MSDKNLPKVAPNALMNAAFAITMFVHDWKDGSSWIGETWFYLDSRRSIAYQQRNGLKTKEGAIKRQKRDTVAFLTDLRTGEVTIHENHLYEPLRSVRAVTGETFAAWVRRHAEQECAVHGIEFPQDMPPKPTIEEARAARAAKKARKQTR